MIWFIVWLAFALFMAWLFARSMRIIWRQQRAWRVFAAKYNLRYDSPLWYKAPSVEGRIKNRRIRIYVDEIVDPIKRVREFRTTVELYFNTGFPTGIALGSRAFHDTIRGIEGVTPVLLPAESEFSGVIAMGREENVAEAYVNAKLDAMRRFFGIPKSERLLMGHEEDGFLVLQSGDPLDEVKALNAMVRDMFQLIEALEPNYGDIPVELENAPVVENSVVSDPTLSLEEKAAIVPPTEESETKE